MCEDGHQHMNKAAHVTARKVPVNFLKERLLTGGLVLLTSTPERTIFLLLSGVHCIQAAALWDQ